MLQRACFCSSGVETGLEDDLDPSCAVAVLQVKGDEGVTRRGGRVSPQQFTGGNGYVGKGQGANMEHTWKIGLPSPSTVGRMREHKRDPQDLAASGALPGPVALAPSLATHSGEPGVSVHVGHEFVLFLM